MIKFRAWDKKHNEMIRVISINFGEKFIRGLTEVESNLDMESSYNFEDIELMQSTGLKDVNNIEVFENDIAKVHEFINIGVDAYEEGEKETIGIIEYGCLYDSPIPEWYLQIKDDCVSFSYMDLHEESFEVIGNVYEHPHLLEE